MQPASALGSQDPVSIGGYRLLSRIAEGGQGVVYLAEGVAGERVALKLLRDAWIEDPSARAQFAREVAAARTVARFCVAQVLDAEVEGTTPYIVSEYVEGPSLMAHVKERGPLAGAALDRLAVATATALTAIHAARIVHRDFKPSNVVLGPDGPRVVDFGIARDLSGEQTSTGRVVGSPNYMAPEQLEGRRLGPAADVFAWGSTMVYAATGRPPFTGETLVALMYQVVSAEPALDGVPEPLRTLVDRCLAKDPDVRPTAEEILLTLLGRPVRGASDGAAAGPGGSDGSDGADGANGAAAAVAGAAVANGTTGAGAPDVAAHGGPVPPLLDGAPPPSGPPLAEGALAAAMLAPAPGQPVPSAPPVPSGPYTGGTDRGTDDLGAPPFLPWSDPPAPAPAAHRSSQRSRWLLAAAAVLAVVAVAGVGTAVVLQARESSAGTGAAPVRVEQSSPPAPGPVATDAAAGGTTKPAVRPASSTPAAVTPTTPAPAPSSGTGAPVVTQPAPSPSASDPAPPTATKTPRPLVVNQAWAGTWSGTVYQTGAVVQEFTMTIKLPVGAARGTIRSPELGCRGVVDVVRPAPTTSRITLRQRTTDDANGLCAAAAAIVLTKTAGNRADLVWVDEAATNNTVTGSLKRA